jgi:hypothetical protein
MQNIRERSHDEIRCPWRVGKAPAQKIQLSLIAVCISTHSYRAIIVDVNGAGWRAPYSSHDVRASAWQKHKVSCRQLKACPVAKFQIRLARQHQMKRRLTRHRGFMVQGEAARKLATQVQAAFYAGQVKNLTESIHETIKLFNECI